MARGRKRNITLTSEEIAKKIEEMDSAIEAKTAEIKELRNVRKNLTKDLKTVQKKEAAKKEADGLKEIYSMLKEKNMTIDELKELIQ